MPASQDFRDICRRFIVPLAIFLMLFGFFSLCQPWSEWLHRYSVTMTLAGLIAFSAFARFASNPT
jgi:hypothetical protein